MIEINNESMLISLCKSVTIRIDGDRDNDRDRDKDRTRTRQDRQKLNCHVVVEVCDLD